MTRKQQQGFTLIELMIVIAIVGILAAIALPAYQDYTVRSKMSEPMAALAEAKTTIAEFYSSNNALPVSQAVSGIQLTRNTEIINQIEYDSVGRLPLLRAYVNQAIIPGGAADPSNTFELSGVTGQGNILEWVCKPGTAAQAIPNKYLPANCRG